MNARGPVVSRPSLLTVLAVPVLVLSAWSMPAEASSQPAIALQAPLDTPDQVLTAASPPTAAVSASSKPADEQPLEPGLKYALALVGMGLLAAYRRDFT
jgi:hypothetical protein